MNLLIDMGNTRLKWAVASNDQIISGLPLLNKEINQANLEKCWQKVPHPKRIAISCVNNIMLDPVISIIQKLWQSTDIVLVKSQAQALGVINAYSQPDKLGVDRWLALLAAWQIYRQASCIVDCGTAITLDLIDAEGHHLGGLICPGLTLMEKSLEIGTTALFVDGTTIPATTLAKNTESAIHNGTLLAAIGLIEHVLVKSNPNTQLILTGGDAPFIAEQLDLPCIVDPEIVLRGLQFVLEVRL